MTNNKRELRLHDCLTHVGWIAGPEAHSLAYWTMRLADELEGVGRYVVPYRALREAAWDSVRAFGTSQHAVSAQYPAQVARFLSRHAVRFPAKYGQTIREIRKALAAIESVPLVTGRVHVEEPALAA